MAFYRCIVDSDQHLTNEEPTTQPVKGKPLYEPTGRRTRPQNMGNDMTRLSKPAQPTNYLRSRVNQGRDRDRVHTQPLPRPVQVATSVLPIRYQEISSFICLYKKEGVDLIPVGKTAEVVRGLFDSTTSRQFLLGVSSEAIEQFGLNQARQRVHDKFIKAWMDFSKEYESPAAFENKAGQGWVTSAGVIYTHIHLGEEGGYTLMSENITSAGIPSLQANYLWWRSSGFYDAEMEKDSFYKAVYDFVKENHGTDHDARAIRALAEYASDKCETNLAALNRMLAFVHNKDLYKQFIDQL